MNTNRDLEEEKRIRNAVLGYKNQKRFLESEPGRQTLVEQLSLSIEKYQSECPHPPSQIKTRLEGGENKSYCAVCDPQL